MCHLCRKSKKGKRTRDVTSVRLQVLPPKLDGFNWNLVHHTTPELYNKLKWNGKIIHALHWGYNLPSSEPELSPVNIILMNLRSILILSRIHALIFQATVGKVFSGKYWTNSNAHLAVIARSKAEGSDGIFPSMWVRSCRHKPLVHSSTAVIAQPTRERPQVYIKFVVAAVLLIWSLVKQKTPGA